MLTKLFNALFDSKGFWREIFKYGFLYKKKSPMDWFIFRHDVHRECALRREVKAGPVRRYVEEVFPNINKSNCQIRFIRSNAYNLSWEELATISQLVATLSPKRIFELGTFDGRTTLHLALNSPDDAVIFTIDIKEGLFEFGADTPFFKEIKIGEYLIDSPIKNKVNMLTGDSKNMDLEKYRDSIDFIFIDGDHSYDGVMNDSNKAFKLIRAGGLVVWHDYLMVNDVTKAILDIQKDKDLINLKGTSLVVWQKPLNNYTDKES